MRPRTVFADQYEEMMDHLEESRPPGPQDRMMDQIVDFVRRSNFTVSPPAHLQPIIWSNPIDLSARVSVPAAVGPYATALSYTCPPGRYARISAYGVTVQDAAYTYDGSILWRLRVNGVQLGEGLSDWGIQRGSVIQPRITFIILREDDVLDLQVRRAVVAAGAQDVDHALLGWTWRLRNNYEGTAASVTAF